MNCDGGDRPESPLASQLPRPFRRRIPTAGFPLLAAAVTAAVFASVVGFGQLPIDDHAYLHDHLAWSSENLARNLTEPVLKLFTPLVSLSFMLDQLLWNGTDSGYHLSNLFLHLAGTLALYGIGRELGLRRGPALFCTLLWAISPQRVESVAWLAERKDVLLGACFLGGLWGALRGLRNGKTLLLAAGLLLGSFSIFSKPTGAAFLPVLALLLVMRRSPAAQWRNFARFGALALPAVLLYFTSGSQPDDRQLWEYLREDPVWFTLLRGCSNGALYFWKSFFPLDLNPVYPTFRAVPACWVVTVGTAVAVAAALRFLWKRDPRQFWYQALPALLIWGALLAPAAGFLVYGNTTFADRNSYLPTPFLLLGVILIVQRNVGELPLRLRRLIWLYPAVLALGTLLYLPVYRSGETLFLRATTGGRINYRIGSTVALQEILRGNSAKAQELLPKIGPFSGMSDADSRDIELYLHFLRGLILHRSGNWNEAAQELGAALNSRVLVHLRGVRKDALLLLFLAGIDITLRNGNPAGAAELHRAIAEYYATDTGLNRKHLGLAAGYSGRPDIAQEHLSETAKYRPDDPEIRAALDELRQNRTGR